MDISLPSFLHPENFSFILAKLFLFDSFAFVELFDILFAIFLFFLLLDSFFAHFFGLRFDRNLLNNAHATAQNSLGLRHFLKWIEFAHKVLRLLLESI